MSDGARQFPCDSCGARVTFAPGRDALVCPYCGSETHIPSSTEGIEEHDFASVTAEHLGEDAETIDVLSVQCDSCAALVEPSPNHEAFPCPYCGSSIVAREKSRRLIKPQAVLPFRVARAEALKAFRRWVRTRWFAPNALKKLARVEDRLRGLYTPYWTYDAGTVSRYTGQRGEEYRVTVRRNGKTVSETRVRWYPAAGTVSRHFDDMLVVGSESLPRGLAEALEPWDLGSLVTYRDEYLSGFSAERYQVDVKRGWVRAAERMEEVIRGDVRRDIGGDRQRIHSLHTTHGDITFKHVLLPMWICSYRYKEKVYRFLVNARTGEVQGERPWSWVKITLAVLAAIVVFVVLKSLEN
ncbi:MAG: hypothetical protein AMS19_08335 [Gemmatimonas sp. SG8_23]|nr:MAG: hypothetical protein AMS19_08335 [Gemmatimonas sp. SG8_23]